MTFLRQICHPLRPVCHPLRPVCHSELDSESHKNGVFSITAVKSDGKSTVFFVYLPRMNFALTNEIRNQIVFSMEDQENSYVFDAVSEKPVLVTDGIVADDDRYYSLPVWDSLQGFQLMERFVTSLRNPMAREALRTVLASGRGVFRNFKLVLKEYPKVEKLWFSFKDHEMQDIISRWYVSLCEKWGLESLGEEPEECDDLLHDDFVFRQVSDESDAEQVFMSTDAIARELQHMHDSDAGRVLSALWQELCVSCNESSDFTLIGETVEGDYAGCITVATLPDSILGSESGDQTHTVILTALYVVPRYRGLGVGRELIEQCRINLQRRGVKWIVAGATPLPPAGRAMLESCGFTSLGTGLIASL